MTVQRMTRREFIVEVGLKAAGAGLMLNELQALPANAGEQPTQEKAKGSPPMAYRPLGKTGLMVSTVSFGVMRLQEPAVLFKAIDLGINYFDTAHVYQNGNNEILLGKVAKEYGRTRIFIASKAQPFKLWKEVPDKLRDMAKKTLDQSLEESLKRLQTDYLDVFFIHSVDDKSWPLNEEILAFIEKIKKQGKARFAGISIHEPDCYVEVIDQVLKSPLYDVILASLNFKSPPEHGEVLKKARKAGLGIIAMKTQAGGYQSASTPSVSPHQAALTWVLEKDYVDCAIPGMVNMEQLAENTAAAGKKLSWSDRKVLSGYYHSVRDRYCTMCGACSGTCSKGIRINTVNRALMYCEGYGDAALGRETYRELSSRVNALSCVGCSSQSCFCVNGIQIAQRMKRAHNLFA